MILVNGFLKVRNQGAAQRKVQSISDGSTPTEVLSKLTQASTEYTFSRTPMSGRSLNPGEYRYDADRIELRIHTFMSQPRSTVSRVRAYDSDFMLERGLVNGARS